MVVWRVKVLYLCRCGEEWVGGYIVVWRVKVLYLCGCGEVKPKFQN